VKTYIKSPINYTGNKYRLLEQFDKYFPDNVDIFIDLFCGGATVGFNVNAKHIILIDSNPRVILLLKTLAEYSIEKIIKNIEYLIEKYKLSYSYKYGYEYYRKSGYVEGNNGLKKYNDEGYKKLRSDYNLLKNKNTYNANIMLYTLMVYAFNNDIRFNKNGEFNLPVGKTDFNKNNINKLKEFNKRAKEINYEFICSDFNDKKIKEKIFTADFVYCDPPYLITTAFYNENNGWNEKNEMDLLLLLSELNKKNIKFALSNVLKKEGKTNLLLEEWIKENNFIKNRINYHYRSSSYNKKNRNSKEEEILVTNGEIDEN
jgi:DNA adenine methylase